jgi:hypothetical protein
MEIKARKRNKNNSMRQCFNMTSTVKTRKAAFSGVHYASIGLCYALSDRDQLFTLIGELRKISEL